VTRIHPGDRELVTMPEPRYEIRIRGRMSPAMAATFEGMTTTVEPVETVLQGTVQDQEALYALLDRIQALGLDLIEIRRMTPEVTEPGA
jgi:hypothetical protein